MSDYLYADQTLAPLMLVVVGVIIIGLAFLIAILYLKFIKKALAKRANDLVLLEVKVPKKYEKQEYETLKTVANITSFADQFFASLGTLYEPGLKGYIFGQPTIALEYVAKDGEIIFFVAVPVQLQQLIEKQIHSYYPHASIEPSGDFRVFKEGLKIAGGRLGLLRSQVFPIKTYEELDADSIASITNVLSKIGEESRAVVQILVRPVNQAWRGQIDWNLRRIQEGKGVPLGGGWPFKAFNSLMSFLSAGMVAKKADNLPRITTLQEEAQKLLTKKSAKTGFATQIRILSLAKSESEAQVNLKNIFSAFGQFSSPDRNGFKLSRKGIDKRFLSHFILRSFLGRKKMILNSEELATLYHFPSEHINTPGIRWFLSKRAPAPANIPDEGLILGKNVYRGEETLIRIDEGDRRRHLYCIGMTGTGKSTFFESMILQDIREGRGVGVFDPHGELVESIMKKVPKSRAEDVIFFNPADRLRPLGLNLLEWKTKDQKDFLVQEAVQIFYKLFDPHGQGFIGPQFEHWMRNAALTLMEYPGGGTLVEIPKLFTDDAFREDRIRAVTDPVVKAFWTQQLAKTADFHKSEMYNYFISKFGRFMTNVTVRNIIGQAKSAFDFREAMDQGKILLINLSKGEIGEINSNLLGMIFVAKLFTSALSRVDVDENQRRDFYLYVDEFQNFATDTFASILSEARKFRLNLNITNQYIAQVPEVIRDAIIGNVGTLVAFRIGVPDAEFMAKEFEPIANQFDLNQIDAFNAYIKLLIKNAPSKPFSMQTIKDETLANEKLGQAITQLSRLKYGRDVKVIESEIMERIKEYSKPQETKEFAREARI
ncbi:MAG: type IV secretion system DNA-binding domain-containing protein [Candidatus Berkelbacteria bacterium]|nr:type IV secretion system DNA-binding domain-containing protein [Candidatus Berkelbacteria bacterium]